MMPSSVPKNGSTPTPDIQPSRKAKYNAAHQIAKASSFCEAGEGLNYLIAEYYSDGLEQAKLSFYSALVASVVATGIFLWVIPSTMKTAEHQSGTKTDQTEATTSVEPNLGLVAGALVQVIAGINFYLYARTTRQLASYHICLERTNRFLLANKLCDELSEAKNEKNEMRSKLIEHMFSAPMLTIAEVTGTVDKASKDNKRNVENSQ